MPRRATGTRAGGVDLESLPEGVVDAVRLVGEGFDQVGQPVVRDTVLLADAQDRVIWLVALDGSAMLDEVLAGVRLTGASDDVFEQSGRCEPPEYLG